MSMTLVVNGNEWIDWFSATVTTTLHDTISSFSLSTGAGNTPFTGFKIQDKVELYTNPLDGEAGERTKIITAYIESVNRSSSNSSATGNYSGRNILCDLLDSSLTSDFINQTGIVNLKTLCQRAVASIGLDVDVLISGTGLKGIIPIDQDFTAKSILAHTTSGKLLDFLQNVARLRQVFIIANEDGNLLLFRPDPTPVNTPLIHNDGDINNNLTNINYSLDLSNRYHTYDFYSRQNANTGSISDNKTASYISATFVDPDIRSTRYLRKRAEKAMTRQELQARAQEECNIRRGESFSYSCTIPNFFDKNGIPYKIGRFIDLQDDVNGVNGQFLIKSITYSSTLQGGDIVQMQLTYPDIYTSYGTLLPAYKKRVTITGVNDG